MMKVFGIIFSSLVFSLTGGAEAQTLINNFGDWSAFSDGKGKAKTCYIASVPKKETGKYKSRGNTYLLVTHRPAEKTRDVIELRAGYVYRQDSEVIVNIDGQVFKLFTDRGTAWAHDAKADRSISRMMIRGKSMIVTGFSKRGTKTEDTYSLSGFTAAYKAIGKACGVK
ncbi:MAG: hypothetical protein HON14_07160 [Rhodospirillaceae bacterium]|jgi:hypothetical protein|nr:hypothetical protein [Rhodospirillaceae bacterium]MBT4588426.1 hypothetical protein [Rhodospirillaceae bacterium]MBT4938895.1 hypothetical protein [Rhodospirillaceae bacterium]MBT5938835.1 hypothetical protein [Rhodospirillaceae bacterium]MBT7267569.1 hypothetical protein [Rhodospirillaceae bacterium]